MFKAIKNKLISLLQLILVIVYILFEELIWEGIAKPVYEIIHGLKILQNLEMKLQNVNPSVILVIFVVLLAMVEAFGVYAGILFVSGQIVLGLALYISKIPIAAFTFWLFRVTKDKLIQFAWFKWLYVKVIDGIGWLKSREVYLETIRQIKIVKEVLRVWKQKYLAKESPFIVKIKKLYQSIKASLKNN